MALTKIGSIGINTGIQFAGVTTIATLNASDNVLSVGGTVNFVSDVSIGGTVSIAGTLTYEDVTNIDAVGLITARNGVVVGSGITLSKDGDGFFTGITTATTFVGALTGNVTGNVTGNISGGTVAGSTGTFSDHVSIAADNKQLKIGAGGDFILYHDGTSTIMTNNMGGTSGNLVIQPKSGESGIKVIPDGAVELYNDNILTLATKSKGVAIGNTNQVFSPDDAAWPTESALNLNGNHGGGLSLNDNGNYGVSMYTINNGQTFLIGMAAKGDSPKTILEGQLNDEIKLYHNGNIKLLTKNTGVTVTGIVTTSSGVSNPDALSHRNMFINGDMWFWQRGVNVSGGTALDVFVTRCDRFWWYGPSTSSGTVQRSTDVPDGFAYSTHNNCDTSINMGTNVHLYNTGVNAPFVHNQSYTFSFYVKSASATSGNTIAITSRDTREGTGSVVRGTVDTYSTTTGWTRIVRTFTLSGTIGGSNKMLQIEFTLDPGEKTTGWQLERGPIATPFEFRNKFDQFEDCQRYYQTSYESEGEPRLHSSDTWSTASGAMSLSKHNAFYDGLVLFQTQMIRDDYTFKWYSSTAQNKVRLELPGVGNTEVDLTSWNNLKKNKNGFFFRHIEASQSGNYVTGSGNGFMRFAWSADAEF